MKSVLKDVINHHLSDIVEIVTVLSTKPAGDNAYKRNAIVHAHYIKHLLETHSDMNTLIDDEKDFTHFINNK